MHCRMVCKVQNVWCLRLARSVLSPCAGARESLALHSLNRQERHRKPIHERALHAPSICWSASDFFALRVVAPTNKMAALTETLSWPSKHCLSTANKDTSIGLTKHQLALRKRFAHASRLKMNSSIQRQRADSPAMDKL